MPTVQGDLSQQLDYFSAMFSSAAYPVTCDKVDATGVAQILEYDALATYTVLQAYERGNALYQKCIVDRGLNTKCVFKLMAVDGYKAVTVATVAEGDQLQDDIVVSAASLAVEMFTRDRSVALRVQIGTIMEITDRRLPNIILFFLRYDKDELLPRLSNPSAATLKLGPMPPMRPMVQPCRVVALPQGLTEVVPVDGSTWGDCVVTVEEGKRNTLLVVGAPGSRGAGDFVPQTVTVGRFRFVLLDMAYHVRFVAAGRATLPLRVDFGQFPTMSIVVMEGFHPTPERVAADLAEESDDDSPVLSATTVAWPSSSSSSEDSESSEVVPTLDLTGADDESSGDEYQQGDGERSPCDEFCGCLDGFNGGFTDRMLERMEEEYRLAELARLSITE